MNIGIVGRHPDLEKGFNGVMSMLWIKGLARFCNSITLYLPISETHKPYELLKKNNFDSFDGLNHWDTNFDIQPISSALEVKNDTDVIIWQSYRPQEEELRKEIRSRGFFMVKNPPRLFSGIAEKDEVKAKGLNREYDLILTSLNQDIRDLSNVSHNNDKFIYLPRGFDVKKLSCKKPENPTIGFDKAVKGSEFGTKSIDHIIESGIALLNEYPQINFLSLRDSIERLKSKRIPLLGYPEFYNEFINKLWIYMPINFDYSVHKKGKVFNDIQHRYIGLYENQIIETQISGGLIMSRNHDIPEELIMLPEESQFKDYNDTNIIKEKLLEHIMNFDERSEKTKKMAIEKHDYLKTTEKLYNILSDIL